MEMIHFYTQLVSIHTYSREYDDILQQSKTVKLNWNNAGTDDNMA